jgi:hypothetical protein
LTIELYVEWIPGVKDCNEMAGRLLDD